MKDDEIRKVVREMYAGVAIREKSIGCSCCGPQETSGELNCCAPQETSDASGCCSPQDVASQAVGYSVEELDSLPEGANMGLGCGNPTALASLKEGEVVLDLGAGGGIDCFLAANAVGKSGGVIGVDMTPEMIEKARENARKGDHENVDFRLGEIEHLPVADNSVDAVISNCVINLSPDKGQVFREAYRTLKPGGRVMVSDIVLLKELPERIKSSVEAYAGCIAGASKKADYLTTIVDAGFRDVVVISEVPLEVGGVDGTIASINVRAVKPN